jgi:hypothetical protein
VVSSFVQFLSPKETTLSHYMIKTFTLFSFLLILSSTVIGSDYYWMKTHTKSWNNSYKTEFLEGKIGTKVLNSLDSIYSKIPSNYTFYFKGKDLQSYISCGLDLYDLKEGELELKYNYLNRGYNCGSTPFVRDSTNYLLGGQGFWISHMDLLRFDEIHGSWEIVNTINQPIDYYSIGVYQNSKGIYSLFGERINIRKGMDENVPNGYFLDWESKEWKEIEIHIEGVDNLELVKKVQFQFIQTQDYFFFIADSKMHHIGWSILEKESGKIYFFDELDVADVFKSPFIEVIGNKINYQMPSGSPKSIDIEYLLSKSKEVGGISIKENSSDLATVFPLRDGIYMVTIIGLVLFSLLLYLRRKSASTPAFAKGNEDIKKMMESFSQYSTQSLNTEQLDEILGIDSTNYDSKRIKRSRWINRLNEYHNYHHGKDLIVRDKNPEDKRYIYYKIS